MRSRHLLALIIVGLAARGAFAQDAPDTHVPSEPELDAPSPSPSPPTPVPAAAPPATGSATATTSSTETLAERGGIFGIGLVIAPKLGGALGSVFLAGAGADLTASLELGYNLPLPQPIGRDIEVFVDAGYAGPSTEQTVNANDARLPGASFHYTLTVHQLAATWGALYRIPLPTDFVRPTLALGVRTVWSDSIVKADSGGKPYGTTSETAFDVGFDARVGGEFSVGPGAIVAELGLSWVPADRFILRKTSTTAVGLAVGYRFML